MAVSPCDGLSVSKIVGPALSRTQCLTAPELSRALACQRPDGIGAQFALSRACPHRAAAERGRAAYRGLRFEIVPMARVVRARLVASETGVGLAGAFGPPWPGHRSVPAAAHRCGDATEAGRRIQAFAVFHAVHSGLPSIGKLSQHVMERTLKFPLSALASAERVHGALQSRELLLAAPNPGRAGIMLFSVWRAIEQGWWRHPRSATVFAKWLSSRGQRIRDFGWVERFPKGRYPDEAASRPQGVPE